MRHPTTTLTTAAIGSLALGLSLSACGGDDDPDPTASTTASTTATADDATTTSAATSPPSTGSVPPTSATTPTTSPTTTPAGTPLDLEDGRHPVFLTSVDVAGRTLGFDVVQFLTGQEAIDAWQAAYPDDPEGPPNDYFIVNENPLLRTAPVAGEAIVMLVRLAEDSDADLDPGTFDELPAYLALSAPAPGDGRALSYSPFWLTIDAGAITGVEEQYVP